MITLELYDPISQGKAIQILREWVDPLWGVPTELEADLQRGVFARLTTADGVYHLSGLGDAAIHDWGRVHDYFHEIVLIDRSAGQLTLIVAADD
ncbi:hypothetical protein [Streptomyces sp. NPDC001635]